MKRIALVLVVACGPVANPFAAPDIPPPLPIIQPQPDDVAACAHLAMLGCPEAWPKTGTCVAAFSQLRTVSQDRDADGGTETAAHCIGGAADIAAVRRCGDRSTVTVACVTDAGP